MKDKLIFTCILKKVSLDLIRTVYFLQSEVWEKYSLCEN